MDPSYVCGHPCDRGIAKKFISTNVGSDTSGTSIWWYLRLFGLNFRCKNPKFELHLLYLALTVILSLPSSRHCLEIAQTISLGLETLDLAYWLDHATTTLVHRSLSRGVDVGEIFILVRVLPTTVVDVDVLLLWDIYCSDGVMYSCFFLFFLISCVCAFSMSLLALALDIVLLRRLSMLDIILILIYYPL